MDQDYALKDRETPRGRGLPRDGGRRDATT